MRLAKPLIATILACLALVAATAGPAAARSASTCARQIQNDWFKDGRVDGVYPIHCYSEAIATLPEDSKQYSSAAEDIRRDMLLAIRGDAPGGPGGPSTGGSGGSPSTGFGGAGTSALSGTAAAKTDKGVFGNFFDTFGPKNASSIPLPLIILAGVALLLLAAGGASFAARRIQARKVSVTPSDRTPPPRP